MAYLEAQPDRTSAITFEFGKHIDIYFGNLEGHGSPNPLKMKFKKSRFWRNCYTGCTKKASGTDFKNFLD